MKSRHFSLIVLALLTWPWSHQSASAQFSWDGDCGINWADCCNFGTEQNPEWHSNWTIAPSTMTCPNLPGRNDRVFASTTVLLAQPYQTWVRSLSVTGTFMLRSELDITDFLTIDGTITEPTTFLLQNGPASTIELHGEHATATISPYATLEFQFDGSLSGGPGALLVNNGLIWKTGPSRSGGLSNLNIPWENNGTISAWAGTLTLSQGGISKGTIEVLGDATVQFSGPADYVLEGEVRGDGLVRFVSSFSGSGTTVTGNYHPTNTLIAGGYATVNFEADTSIENLTLGNTGTIGGAANLAIDDLLWNGGYSTMMPGGTTIVQDTALIQYDTFAGGSFALNRQMELHGDSVLDGGQLAMTDGTLRNYGELHMLGGSSISQGCCGPSSLVQNFGTLRKVSGAPSVINAVFLSPGEVAVESGELHFDGEMTNDGQITVNTGATLGMGHKQQSNLLLGSIAGAGAVFFYNDFWSGDETVDSIQGEYDVGTTTIQAGSVSFDTDGIIAPQKTTGTLNLIQGFGATKLLGNADLIVTEQFNWNTGEMAGTGTTFVHGPMILTFGGYVVNLSRTLELHIDSPVAGSPPDSSMSINPLGTLRCTRVTIDTNVNNSGIVAPGTSDAPIGYLHLTGGYTQNSNGRLAIDLASASGHDQLLADGAATLSGTLTVNLLGGYSPAAGQSFTILTAQNVNGAFTTINGPPGMEIAFHPQSVVVSFAGPPCAPADLNCDGHVNGIDLALLLGAWTGVTSYSPCPRFAPADLNQDCKVNGLDLAMLLAAWTG